MLYKLHVDRYRLLEAQFYNIAVEGQFPPLPVIRGKVPISDDLCAIPEAASLSRKSQIITKLASLEAARQQTLRVHAEQTMDYRNKHGRFPDEEIIESQLQELGVEDTEFRDICAQLQSELGMKVPCIPGSRLGPLALKSYNLAPKGQSLIVRHEDQESCFIHTSVRQFFDQYPSIALGSVHKGKRGEINQDWHELILPRLDMSFVKRGLDYAMFKINEHRGVYLTQKARAELTRLLPPGYSIVESHLS